MFEKNLILNALANNPLSIQEEKDLMRAFGNNHFSIGEPKKKLKSIDWEISRSSLSKSIKSPSYEQCRTYACNDIIKNLTYLNTDLPFITELPRGSKFCFLVRVGTDMADPNSPVRYYNQFAERNYISFSTITNKNVSHYGIGGNILFAYNITADLIAHIFPMDCDSDSDAINEEDITEFPSLWLTLQDLNESTLKLKTYNQITCKTKQDGKILKPCRIIVIDEIDDYITSVARSFGIGCTIIHPDKTALCETYDPFFPMEKDSVFKASQLFRDLKKFYSINENERRF